MSLLTSLTQAQIEANQTELDGKVLTRPALLVTDGDALVYAVDVDIGNAAQVLRNVPLARANRELMYAEPGNPVRLRRTADGRFEVVGFSREMPGTFERFAVDLGTLSFGPLENLSLDAVAVQYADLATLSGGYGVVPYGVTAIYRGGVLIELRS
jgi:hypothetical protein